MQIPQDLDYPQEGHSLGTLQLTKLYTVVEDLQLPLLVTDPG